MGRIDLSGRVAVVTGGGGGMGRSHALLLAQRGAKVVVNDIGTAMDGTGTDEGPAHAVAEEIRQAGGTAIPSTHDCGSEAGGRALAELALAEFGQVDLFLHNAGIVFAADFADAPLDKVRQAIDVHLMTAWYVGQPIWADMLRRGYGRVVFKASGAIFGHPMIGPYAAAKHGLIGLSRSLHHEALMAGADIKVNVVCPIAATRMARDSQKQRWGDLCEPSEVSAVVAYLLSEACAISGEVLNAGGTHFSRNFLAQTPGWALRKPGLTPEDVRDHLDEGLALEGWRIPENTNQNTDFMFECATGRVERLDTREVAPGLHR